MHFSEDAAIGWVDQPLLPILKEGQQILVLQEGQEHNHIFEGVVHMNSAVQLPVVIVNADVVDGGVVFSQSQDLLLVRGEGDRAPIGCNGD